MDLELYAYAQERFARQIEQRGAEFAREVASFRENEQTVAAILACLLDITEDFNSTFCSAIETLEELALKFMPFDLYERHAVTRR